MPRRLPPQPPIVFGSRLNDLLERANRAIGRLDCLALLLPDISLFLYFYVRKEAVVSSQIEGTQSSLSDLLFFESHETPGVSTGDVEEVSTYVAALNQGLRLVRDSGNLTNRMLREVHAILLSSGRESDQQPGEYRRSQNWIGGTRPGNARYVPPPAHDVPAMMADLEKFLHDVPARTPTLIKAALAHVQFETIHPFLDGNGRLGRLLITLTLCREGALREPLLYLSLYLKRNRTRYYELLQQVREAGLWEEWLQFFLVGVEETADEAAETARRLLSLLDEDRRKLEGLGRAAGTLLRVHGLLSRSPITYQQHVADELRLSRPAVLQAFERMQTLGIIRDQRGPGRRRWLAYGAYLDLLSEGTEPLR